MPVNTVISSEFAKIVKQVIGDLKPSQVSYRVGVSDVYIYKLMKGLVPSEQVIEKFAKGMADRWSDGYDDLLLQMRIIAGYEHTTDPVLAVKFALRGNGVNLSPEGKAQIEAFTQRVKEKEAKKKQEKEAEESQM